MKRYLFLLFFFLCLSNPAFSDEAIQKCIPYMTKADNSKNIDDKIKALECIYKLDVSGQINVKENTDFNRLDLLRMLTFMNFYKYQYTRSSKYLDDAYKYAFDAVQNKTKDVNMIVLAIATSNEKMKEKKIIEAYEYLCSVDKNECDKYFPKVSLAVKNIKDYKKQVWASAFYQISNDMKNTKIRFTNCYANGFGVNCSSY